MFVYHIYYHECWQSRHFLCMYNALNKSACLGIRWAAVVVILHYLRIWRLQCYVTRPSLVFCCIKWDTLRYCHKKTFINNLGNTLINQKHILIKTRNFVKNQLIQILGKKWSIKSWSTYLKILLIRNTLNLGAIPLCNPLDNVWTSTFWTKLIDKDKISYRNYIKTSLDQKTLRCILLHSSVIKFDGFMMIGDDNTTPKGLMSRPVSYAVVTYRTRLKKVVTLEFGFNASVVPQESPLLSQFD